MDGEWPWRRGSESGAWSSISEGDAEALTADARRVELEAQRRRRLRALPAKAEDEIVRIQNVKLRQKVSKYKAEEQRRVTGSQSRRKKDKRRHDGEWRLTGKRLKLNADVRFTTLAEVALAETADARWVGDGCTFDTQGKYGVEGLLGSCLRELDDVEEANELDMTGTDD